MERLAIDELLKWKNKQYRKPLIIAGARQVGKTWLVKEFARQNYKQLAYVNFEEMKILQYLFEQDFSIPRILTAIGAATNVTCTEGETLIFLDEIQAAPHAVTSLKYFAENAPGYHVIAAGSLLGIELHQGESFPVGKVEFLSLYPMNFIEFVMAMGEKNLAQLLLTKDWNMITMFAPKFQELLKYYYYVGGMPEAVLSFSQNRDWKEVRTIQKDILSSYQRDMSKHAPSEIIPRITDLWKSLPAQLSKENRKFIYGVVREGARAREYELALQWLLDAGLIYKVYNVKAPRLPLASYEDRAAFKIFVLDVGLLGAQVRKSVDSPPDMLTKRLSSHGTCFPIKSSTFASWQRRLPNLTTRYSYATCFQKGCLTPLKLPMSMKSALVYTMRRIRKSAFFISILTNVTCAMMCGMI